MYPHLFPPPQKCGVFASFAALGSLRSNSFLRITMLQDLRARRKSYDHTKHLGLGDSSRQGAKIAKFG